MEVRRELRHVVATRKSTEEFYLPTSGTGPRLPLLAKQTVAAINVALFLLSPLDVDLTGRI